VADVQPECPARGGYATKQTQACNTRRCVSLANVGTSTEGWWYQGTINGRQVGLTTEANNGGSDYTTAPSGYAVTGALVSIKGVLTNVVKNSVNDYYCSMDGVNWAQCNEVRGVYDSVFVKTDRHPNGITPAGTPAKPVKHCQVSNTWSAWSRCSTKCGGGNRKRVRTGDVQPKNGGRACPATTETEACASRTLARRLRVGGTRASLALANRA